MQLRAVDAPHADAGFVRLWAAGPGSLADRMLHFRLCAGPVDTQLFFLFGRADSVMPHFHAQVVQFSPEACVFNADFLPRLDPVDYPDYFRQVFDPLNMPYWKAINDYQNVCSHAPGNPAIATYSVALVDRHESAGNCDRTREGHAEHSRLIWRTGWNWPARSASMAPMQEVLRQRDTRHLECFLDERPRSARMEGCLYRGRQGSRPADPADHRRAPALD